MPILALAVDPHGPFGNAHHAFDARHGRQPCPFEQADGLKDRFRVENPAAGLIALAAVEVAAPALVLGQAECGETAGRARVVNMLRARRQRGGVAARLIEQGEVDITLGCLHLATIAAPALPPVGQGVGAFGRFSIVFIGHNDVRRGQLIAEIVVIDDFFIQQLTGIEDTHRSA